MTHSPTIFELTSSPAKGLALKPKLRGWLHAGTAPFVLAVAIVLVALAPTISVRISLAVFGVTALSLFGTSAVYHISNGHIANKVTAILKRIDHANIFLIIAGTYTPLSLMLLPISQTRLILAIVWSGAILGVLLQVFWHNAPRWISAPVYLALGWVAVGFIRDFALLGGPAIVTLIIAGGVAYSLGAIVYALKKPNPSVKWFGFHEVFHAFTVLGFALHTIAIFIAVMGAR
jgi:hemolysin III